MQDEANTEFFDGFLPTDKMLKEESEPASEEDLKEGLKNICERQTVSGSTLLDFFNQLQVKTQFNSNCLII